MMQKRSSIFLGVVVLLGVVATTLWYELRAERNQDSDLGAPTTHAPSIAVEQVHQPELAQLPQRTIEPKQPDLVVNPQAPSAPTARESAMARMIANARVNVWVGRLAAQGSALTPDEVRALKSVAAAELTREEDETAAMARTATRTDPQSVAQAKEDLIRRQNETNVRILHTISPSLTAQQVQGLRQQFEEWYTSAQASARAQRASAAGGQPH
jgi:hypothetical protein